MNTNPFPVRRKTLVDFIKTDSHFGEKDGEIIVTAKVRLQLNKLDVYGVSSIWKKRFPWVNSNGVFTVTGKALCGDEPFDYNKGRNIAETRAQVKAYTVASKIFNMINEYLKEQASWLKYYSRNCESCAETSNEHVKELDQ